MDKYCHWAHWTQPPKAEVKLCAGSLEQQDNY